MSRAATRSQPKVDMAQVRAAIRDRRKLRIAYVDEKGHRTRRTIWPLAMAYYVDVSLVGAWCELRKDLRNFRVERIASSRMLAARFQDHNGRLLAQWLAQPKERPRIAGVRIEPRRGQPGEAGLGELRAIELEERRGNGVEAEGIAFLQNDAGKLAPDFDDEGFGQVMLDSVLDHGADLPCPHRHGHEPTKGQWWSLPNPSRARANNDACGINMAVGIFPRWRSGAHDETMTARCPFD